MAKLTVEKWIEDSNLKEFSTPVLLSLSIEQLSCVPIVSDKVDPEFFSILAKTPTFLEKLAITAALKQLKAQEKEKRKTKRRKERHKRIIKRRHSTSFQTDDEGDTDIEGANETNYEPWISDIPETDTVSPETKPPEASSSHDRVPELEQSPQTTSPETPADQQKQAATAVVKALAKQQQERLAEGDGTKAPRLPPKPATKPIPPPKPKEKPKKIPVIAPVFPAPGPLDGVKSIVETNFLTSTGLSEETTRNSSSPAKFLSETQPLLDMGMSTRPPHQRAESVPTPASGTSALYLQAPEHDHRPISRPLSRLKTGSHSGEHRSPSPNRLPPKRPPYPNPRTQSGGPASPTFGPSSWESTQVSSHRSRPRSHSSLPYLDLNVVPPLESKENDVDFLPSTVQEGSTSVSSVPKGRPTSLSSSTLPLNFAMKMAREYPRKLPPPSRALTSEEKSLTSPTRRRAPSRPSLPRSWSSAKISEPDNNHLPQHSPSGPERAKSMSNLHSRSVSASSRLSNSTTPEHVELRPPPPPPQALSATMILASGMNNLIDPSLINFDMKNIRDQVVKEILKTEETYVHSLKTFNSFYILPLKTFKNSKDPMVTEEQWAILFGQMDLIHKMHVKLLAELSHNLLNWPQWSQIGLFFMEFAPFFRMYSDYSQHYSTGLQLLGHLLKKSKKFLKFQKESMKDFHVTTIESYLILPIQRIPRYEMLIKELLKHTDESSQDHKDLLKALGMISSSCARVNESIRDKQNFERIMEIQKKFENCIFVAPHRQFVKEGLLLVRLETKDKQYQFFLFSDVLVMAKKAGQKFKLHTKVEVNDAFSVQDLPNKRNCQKDRFLIWSSTRSFSCIAESRESKRDWVNKLQDIVAKYSAQLRQVSPNSNASPKATLYEQCSSCIRYGLCTRCELCHVILCNKCAPTNNSSTKSKNKTSEPTWNTYCDSCKPKILGASNQAEMIHRRSVSSPATISGAKQKANVAVKEYRQSIQGVREQAYKKLVEIFDKETAYHLELCLFTEFDFHEESYQVRLSRMIKYLRINIDLRSRVQQRIIKPQELVKMDFVLVRHFTLNTTIENVLTSTTTSSTDSDSRDDDYWRPINASHFVPGANSTDAKQPQYDDFGDLRKFDNNHRRLGETSQRSQTMTEFVTSLNSPFDPTSSIQEGKHENTSTSGDPAPVPAAPVSAPVTPLSWKTLQVEVKSDSPLHKSRDRIPIKARTLHASPNKPDHRKSLPVRSPTQTSRAPAPGPAGQRHISRPALMSERFSFSGRALTHGIRDNDSSGVPSEDTYQMRRHSHFPAPPRSPPTPRRRRPSLPITPKNIRTSTPTRPVPPPIVPTSRPPSASTSITPVHKRPTHPPPGRPTPPSGRATPHPPPGRPPTSGRTTHLASDKPTTTLPRTTPRPPATGRPKPTPPSFEKPKPTPPTYEKPKPTPPTFEKPKSTSPTSAKRNPAFFGGVPTMVLPGSLQQPNLRGPHRPPGPKPK